MKDVPKLNSHLREMNRMHLLLQKPKSGSVMHQPTPKSLASTETEPAALQLGRLPFQIERLSHTNSVNKLDIGIEMEMEFCTHCTQDLWNTARSGILRLVRWLGPEAISVKATKSKSVGPSN